MMGFVRCAWCTDFISENDEIGRTKAICAACQSELQNIKILKLDEFSRKFLDDLPYGNIILNPDNTVLRYNATEAKFTGYDPSRIEGKDFFEDIAPCARDPAFKGTLDQFKAAKTNAQHLFKYTFDNPKFNALVSILMTYYAESGYTVVSVRKIKDIDVKDLQT